MKKNFNFDVSGLFLVIVDVQERLVKAMPEKVVEQIYKNINLFTLASKVYNIPVIVTEQYPKGLGETASNITKNLKDFKKVVKTTFSCCYSKLFNKEIEELKRKTAILVGMETHVCIFQTTLGLLENGYKVFIPNDAVCSRAKKNWENGIKMLSESGALISNTESMIFQMLKDANSSEFKQLSPFLK